MVLPGAGEEQDEGKTGEELARGAAAAAKALWAPGTEPIVLSG